MVTIARAASCNVSSRIVAKRCGSSVWSMTPTVTPSASSQMLRVGFPATFMAALISRFAAQRTWRGGARHTRNFPRIRRWRAAIPAWGGRERAEHPGSGRRCEGISMLRHFAPVAFLAFTMMLSILPAKAAGTKPVIEVVFVLDTTGSMGPADRGRQTQDLVDRHHADRLQPRRRDPHGPRRLSRHRRRLRHQDLRPHHRHPGPLCRPAAAARKRRRRLAGKRQRGAVTSASPR